MIYPKRATYLGDDAGGLPSSELLYQPTVDTLPAPSSSMVFPAITITATPPGTGPATLPATAPVPLTEDEIAEAYGGNPTINVLGTASALGLNKNTLLLSGVLLGLFAVTMAFKKDRRGRGRRRRR